MGKAKVDTQQVTWLETHLIIIFSIIIYTINQGLKDEIKSLLQYDDKYARAAQWMFRLEIYYLDK